MSRKILSALAVAALLGLGACTSGVPASERFAESTILTAESRQSLTARVNAFDRAVNSGNMKKTLDFLPPKVVAIKAEEAGMTPEFAKATIGAMLTGMTRDLKITGRSDLSKSVVGKTSADRPYVIYPTAARLVVDGESMDDQGNALALLDEGQWYLMDLGDDDEIANLRQAYPDFRSVPLNVE